MENEKGEMNGSLIHPPDILQWLEDGSGSDEMNETVSNDVILSARVSAILQLMFFSILGGLVSIFGIIANIINIIVFVKQGAYKECGTVNLLGLAVSDLCVVVTMLYVSGCYSLVIINPPNLPWEPFNFGFLTGGWPHLMFAQITRTITAYVAFERCMCVMFPFKVKSMLSPKRSIIIIVSIFVCFAISFSPAFIKQQLRYTHDPVVNRSRIVLVLMPDWQYVVDVMWYINSLAFNLGSVAVVLVCTLITASRVQLSKTWRNTMATGNAKGAAIESKDIDENTETKSETISKQNVMSSSKMQKEKKLITMIISISVIFLFCYVSDFTFLLMYTIDPNIRTFGKYHNMALVMHSMTFFMETFNSSINIVVYYKMSSKYKRVFREWVGLSTQDG